MAPKGRRRGVQRSSTPLEILFFLNGWYCASYFLIEALIFLYKGLILPYPTSNLVLEVVMLVLYLGIEVTRLILGCRGNLCERKLPLVVSVGLTVPAGLLAVYFLLLQTYSLRLETVLSCILLLFYSLEVILSAAALITFCRRSDETDERTHLFSDAAQAIENALGFSNSLLIRCISKPP
ncbi:transmembrane protein 216 [Pelodytes ibericus]